MSSITKDFIAYEYLSIEVPQNEMQSYVDCYHKFGWNYIDSSENSKIQDYYINDLSQYKIKLAKINFKRDRKIKNKSELLTLQKEMEDSFKKIEKLKKQPELISTIYSISIGVIGIPFLIFSILSFKSSIYLLGILNIIISLICFMLGYFKNNKIQEQKEEQNRILIEEQYDIIYEYCEKANKLIQ